MARLFPWTIIVDEAWKKYEEIEEIVSANPDEAIQSIVTLRGRLGRIIPLLSDEVGPMYNHAREGLERIKRSLLDLEISATGRFNWIYPLSQN